MNFKLKPLKFNGYDTVRDSLSRLQVFKQDTWENEIIVAEDGDSYLLSDILALSSRQARKHNIVFLDKTGNQYTVEQLRTGINSQVLLHNRPLVSTLRSLKTYDTFYTVDIPSHTSILFPFPPVLPVITEQEKTEEEFRLKEYNRYLLQKTQTAACQLMLPNNALRQLYLHSKKQRKQIDDYQLAVNHVLSKYLPNCEKSDEYEAALEQYPQLTGSSYADLQVLAELSNKRLEALTKKLHSREKLYANRNNLFQCIEKNLTIAGVSVFVGVLVIMVVAGPAIGSFIISGLSITSIGAYVTPDLALVRTQRKHCDLEDFQRAIELVMNYQQSKEEHGRLEQWRVELANQVCAKKSKRHFARERKSSHSLKGTKMASKFVTSHGSRQAHPSEVAHEGKSSTSPSLR